MTSGLERFLFTTANAHAVAALRIWLAALAAFAFFAQNFATPSSLVQAGWMMQFYSDVVETPPYWAAAGAALAAFGAGLWSRPAGLLAALLLAPLVPMQGALIGRYLLWFAIAVMALLHSDRRWALRSVLGFPQTREVGPAWPVRLIQIQLSLLYLVNALAKSSEGYLSGGALAAMSTRLPNFQMQFSEGLFILAGIAVPLWMAAVASALAEYYLALGFWFPKLRWPTAVFGLAFHWSLTWIVKIGLLDVAAVGLYAAFLLPVAGRRDLPQNYWRDGTQFHPASSSSCRRERLATSRCGSGARKIGAFRTQAGRWNSVPVRPKVRRRSRPKTRRASRQAWEWNRRWQSRMKWY